MKRIGMRKGFVSVFIASMISSYSGRVSYKDSLCVMEARMVDHRFARPNNDSVTLVFAAANTVPNNAATATKRFPDICWLLSFPNSGTSYTLSNVAVMTQRATASNYAKRHEPQALIRPAWPHGPFSRHPQKMLPAYSILTKTHCGGFCDDCNDFVLDLDEFAKQCGRTAHSPDPNSLRIERHFYPPAWPTKAVHLIRDPFDNLFARIHLAVHRRAHHLGWNSTKLEQFNQSNPRDSYENWCFRDRMSHALQNGTVTSNGTTTPLR